MKSVPASDQPRDERREAHTFALPAFGELVLRFRTAAGITQEKLAERATISIRAIGDLERGIRGRPQQETVRLLADALGLAGEEREQFTKAARQRPSRSPSLTPVATVPSNLPAQLTPLVGRGGDIRAVCAAVRATHTRLLTIIGPGGVGKTRLAIEAATTLRQEYTEGVVFVSLAAVRDPVLALSAIAQTLGVRERAGEPLQATVRGWIGQKQLLLLLDNFEHLLPAAPLITDALAACPGLTVLVTSRGRSTFMASTPIRSRRSLCRRGIMPGKSRPLRASRRWISSFSAHKRSSPISG